MIRIIGIVCVVLALVLVHAPPKETNGHERNLLRESLDRLAQDPVIVKVSVLNEETGNSVVNLTAEDFIIDENGERQKPTRFLREERPLSILLMIDSSGSMGPILQPTIEVVSNGLKHLKPDDEVALMSFNQEVDILQDFTKNKGWVEEKLRGVLARRIAHTRQALVQAATHMLKTTAANSRRVIVVLTDNLPAMPEDVLSEKVVMQQLSASASVVCGIIVSKPPLDPYPSFRDPFKKPTDDITPYVVETGGIVETIKKGNVEDISARLVKTIDAFRNYYWIEYLSTDSKRDGKHRKIKVTLSPGVKNRGAKLTVLAKRGYYAPNDTTSADQK